MAAGSHISKCLSVVMESSTPQPHSEKHLIPVGTGGVRGSIWAVRCLANKIPANESGTQLVPPLSHQPHSPPNTPDPTPPSANRESRAKSAD